MLLTAALAAATPADAAPRYALFPPAKAAPAPSDATRAIVARADRALDRPPAPLPHLHTEGTLPGHGIRDISLKAKEDQPIVLDLALAWRITGDRRYLNQAARYLSAWAETYQPSFNPIDETGFDALVMATDLTGPSLLPPLRARLDAFWRSMALGYLDAMDGTPKGAGGNWGSHRVKLATMAAFETGDAALIARARAAYHRQIAANIRPDGSVRDFAERDALHYVTYDLDPLLMAAASARAHGEDWYRWRAPSGASLPLALRWLEPFARGTATHVEFVHSTVTFDRDRAGAGDAEYAPHIWDRRNAVSSFSLAALCDPAYRPLAAALTAATGRQPAGWIAFVR